MTKLDLMIRVKILTHQDLVVQVGQVVYQKLMERQEVLEFRVVLDLLVRQGLRELPGQVECQVILDLVELVIQAVRVGLVDPQDHHIIQKLLDLVGEYSTSD